MPKERTSRQPEVLLDVTRRGDGPLHEQIERALREAARSGRLKAGRAVPSTRALARDLRVSRGVIVEAYEQLVAEGYLETRPGSRTVVAAAARATPQELVERPLPGARFDFRPGLPDLTRFPREDWSRAARRVFRELHPRQLGYGDPRGTMELRSALADYLGRVRGVMGRPERVIVCSGFAQALLVAGQTLARRGVRKIAVEEPGHPEQARILSQAGLTPVAVAVDGRGLMTDALERSRAQAALVSPAHQFPTGSVLAPERRRELLAWAVRRSAFIVEDDYDAEYRYDRSPLGALQGLAPERVLYAGSASKILAPALRLGWLVLPGALLATAAEVKKYADLGSPFIEQLVYAEFLGAGALDRHLRRMRALYRERRDALLSALARHCPRWIPQGAAAGLHLTVLLPAGVEEERVVRHAERRSVRLYPMSHYRAKAAPANSGAIVMGYACLTEREIRQAVAQLAATGVVG
jgi:GntR family transcriptional regulator/MocR family aminotransferase